MAGTTKKPKELPLRDRIIDMRRIPARDLLQNPGNYRRHPQFQRDVLAGVLREIGIADTLVVYDSPRHGGMTIIDGHLRAADHVTEWPCAIVDLTDEEADYLLLVKDPLAALAETDASVHARTLRGVQSGEAAVQQFLSEQAAEYGLLDTEDDQKIPPEIIEDEPPDLAEELREKWGTELGQVWELRKHVIGCGDSTDQSFVERVLKGKKHAKPRMVWTDPPYGVSYGDKNRFLNEISPANRIQKPIKNDDASGEEVSQVLQQALAIIVRLGEAGCSCYATVPPGPLHKSFIEAYNASGFTYKHQLVWVKNQFVLGRSDYHYKHEPIIYGWIENAAHYFIDDHGKSTVFMIDKPRKNDMHPTMKPIKLIAEMIVNSSKSKECVYDPFLGSGTTLIACEQTDRIARGCEIDPGYTAVCLERWSNLTGETPKLIT